MTCSCGGEFVAREVFRTPVRICNGCGQVFLPRAHRDLPFARLQRTFTPRSLEQLKQVGEERLERLRMEGRGELDLRCPVCEATMVRCAFAPGSGIVVHECAAHGTLGERNWLVDAVAFVAGGGELLALGDLKSYPLAGRTLDSRVINPPLVS